MATGKVKGLYPPGNNGSRPGAGQIVEDGTGKKYAFHTPDDLDQASVPIEVGTVVNFEISNGNSIGNVRLAVPTCIFTADKTSINIGETVILSWTTQNFVSLTLDHGIGAVTPVAKGSITVSPTTSLIYNLTAIPASGEGSIFSVSIAVAGGEGPGGVERL